MHAIRHVAAIACLMAIAQSASAQAVITQNSALAGNVTPGDAAGFPITITQPGSYKLMSNLVVPAGTGGIEIKSDNVTLDLNGFTIAGPTTCTRTTATMAVTCSTTTGGYSNVGVKLNATGGMATVRNGSVQGFMIGVFGDYGWLNVDNLSVKFNSYMGVALTMGGTLSNSRVQYNGSYGVNVTGSAINRVDVSYNGGFGIYGDRMSPVSDSTVSYNKGIGVRESTLKGVTLINNAGGNTYITYSLGGNYNSATSSSF